MNGKNRQRQDLVLQKGLRSLTGRQWCVYMRIMLAVDYVKERNKQKSGGKEYYEKLHLRYKESQRRC